MSLILAGLGLAGNLIGGFGAAAQRKRLEQEREKILNEVARNNDDALNLLRSGNMRALYGATGVLGDSLQANARNMGDALASAGVYNSSATAGAIEQNAARNASILAQMASEGMQREGELRGSGQRDILNRRLDYINQDLGIARGGESAAFGALGGSLADLIGSLSPRNNGVYMNGNQGKSPLRMGDTAGDGPLYQTKKRKSILYGPPVN